MQLRADLGGCVSRPVCPEATRGWVDLEQTIPGSLRKRQPCQHQISDLACRTGRQHTSIKPPSLWCFVRAARCQHVAVALLVHGKTQKKKVLRFTASEFLPIITADTLAIKYVTLGREPHTPARSCSSDSPQPVLAPASLPRLQYVPTAGG